MKYLGPLIAFIIAVALAFLLMLVAQDDSQGDPIPPELLSVYDKRIDRLDRRGVEAAYSSRIALLFQNWMTDTGPESAKRAKKGYVNARKIYIEVMTGIDARDPDGTVLNEPK